MGANLFLDAVELGVLVIMTASPGVFLLCIATQPWHKVIAVCLFVLSVTGFVGLKHKYDQKPKQVTNLYNYGEKLQ